MAGISGYTNKKLNDLGTYNPSSAVTAAQTKAAEYEAKNNPANTSQYGSISQKLLDSYLNRGAFSYDMNSDPLYKQYKDQYICEGKNAMEDTIADAASLTGGYGNSYGITAGSQAYQSYLDRLNDKSLEFSQLAYDKYNQEGADMYNKYAAASAQYQNLLQDYYNNRDYYNNAAQQAYSNDYNQHANDRNYWQNIASQESSNYWNDAQLRENQRQFNDSQVNSLISASVKDAKSVYDKGEIWDEFVKAYQKSPSGMEVIADKYEAMGYDPDEIAVLMNQVERAYSLN